MELKIYHFSTDNNVLFYMTKMNQTRFSINGSFSQYLTFRLEAFGYELIERL